MTGRVVHLRHDMPFTTGTCTSEGLGYREVAAILHIGKRTAQRRLADWYGTPGGPRVTAATKPGRAGRAALTITRDELARVVPEIDE